MDEANQLCQRIAVINEGRIIAVDTPDRLKQAATEVQVVEVVFDRALDPAELGELSGHECCGELRKQEDSYRIITDDPPLVLGAIYPFMERHGLKPLSINTFGPSLEDVFIKLTDKGKGVAEDE
jgi:ABC-2 type transport system ATP-binding protein